MSPKLSLPRVTLVGIDCIDPDRLKRVMDICTDQCIFGAVTLLTSCETPYSTAIRIPAINSLEAYSRFLIEELFRYVQTDFVLIVQYDGFILNPSAWTDDFFSYDYIGAPWYHEGPLRVGNGGFSLRSKKLLEHGALLYAKLLPNQAIPEDTWLCDYARPYLEKEGIHFAPVPVAKQFSFEGGFSQGSLWNGAFGFHDLAWTDISLFTATHPKYGIVPKPTGAALFFRTYWIGRVLRFLVVFLGIYTVYKKVRSM